MSQQPAPTPEELQQIEQVVSDCLDQRPADAADCIREAPAALRDDILLRLPKEQAADILEELPDDIAAKTVMDMTPEQAAPIVSEMVTDDETDLLQEVSDQQAEAIIEQYADDRAAAARELLQYDEDTAGGLMQREFITVRPGETAAEVVRDLRKRAGEYADYPASYLYVVNQAGTLLGIVSLRALLLCDADARVDGLTLRAPIQVSPELEARELVQQFRKYHFLAIPVVDDFGKLLGIVTQDDALRVAQEAGDEEMLRLAGIAGGDEFRDMPLLRRSGRRLSWLSINILLNVAAASVIAAYQETLQAVIALAVFLPIISDMSGCSGNQAVAVSIRELTLDRTRPADYLRVMSKELSVGLLNGLALGSIIAVVAWLWKGDVTLGLIVGGALWVNTLVAVTIGGLTPLLLKQMKQDPAIASGPILTTLTDMCGFFVVLALASQFLV